MPPFNRERPVTTPVQPSTERRPAKSLEDFANEIFGQLNEKSARDAQPMPVERPVQEQVIVQQVEEKVVSRADNRRAPMRTEAASSKERSLAQKLKEQETGESFHVVPTSQKALMQAIIMSEVLGQPKAKQR